MEACTRKLVLSATALTAVLLLTVGVLWVLPYAITTHTHLAWATLILWGATTATTTMRAGRPGLRAGRSPAGGRGRPMMAEHDPQDVYVALPESGGLRQLVARPHGPDVELFEVHVLDGRVHETRIDIWPGAFPMDPAAVLARLASAA